MTIKLLTAQKRNFIYRGPTQSLKLADFLEEVQSNIQRYVGAYNDLYSLIQNFSSGSLSPIGISGYLHPSGFVLPEASGYLEPNEQSLRSLEGEFQAHLLDDFSN